MHGDLQPDLTLWFDLDPGIAAARRAAAREPDRFEQQETDFFLRVQAGYRARMEASPQRVVRIDAAQSIDAVTAEIALTLSHRGC